MDARRDRRTVNTDPLPVSTPAAQGVAANCVQAFLDALETTPGADPHSLMILRHGHVVVSGWWWPYTPERLHLLYSLSKSFTSTAASLAVADGLLRLDDPVIAYFPELDAEVTRCAGAVNAGAPRCRHGEWALGRHMAAGDVCVPGRTGAGIPPATTRS